MFEKVAVYRIQKAELEKPESYRLEIKPSGDFGPEIYGDRAGLTYLRDSLSELLEDPEGLGYHIHLVTVNNAGKADPNGLFIGLLVGIIDN